MQHFNPMGERENPPSLRLAPLSFNVDVRRRAIDPFLCGVVIGAMATVLGMLLGMLLLFPIQRE